MVVCNDICNISIVFILSTSIYATVVEPHIALSQWLACQAIRRCPICSLQCAIVVCAAPSFASLPSSTSSRFPTAAQPRNSAALPHASGPPRDPVHAERMLTCGSSSESDSSRTKSFLVRAPMLPARSCASKSSALNCPGSDFIPLLKTEYALTSPAAVSERDQDLTEADRRRGSWLTTLVAQPIAQDTHDRRADHPDLHQPVLYDRPVPV